MWKQILLHQILQGKNLFLLHKVHRNAVSAAKKQRNAASIALKRAVSAKPKMCRFHCKNAQKHIFS